MGVALRNTIFLLDSRWVWNRRSSSSFDYKEGCLGGLDSVVEVLGLGVSGWLFWSLGARDSEVAGR